MHKYFFLAYFLALQIIALKARIKPHAFENMQRILAFVRNYLCLFENKQFNGARSKVPYFYLPRSQLATRFPPLFINSWIIAKCEPRFNILPCTQALWGLCVCMCVQIWTSMSGIYTLARTNTHTLALAFNKYKRHSSLSAYVRSVL